LQLEIIIIKQRLVDTKLQLDLVSQRADDYLVPVRSKLSDFETNLLASQLTTKEMCDQLSTRTEIVRDEILKSIKINVAEA